MNGAFLTKSEMSDLKQLQGNNTCTIPEKNLIGDSHWFAIIQLIQRSLEYAKKLRGIKARNSGISGKWRLNVFFFWPQAINCQRLRHGTTEASFLSKMAAKCWGSQGRGRWDLWSGDECLCFHPDIACAKQKCATLEIGAFYSFYFKLLLHVILKGWWKRKDQGVSRKQRRGIWLKVERRVTGPQVRTNALLWKVSK